MAHLDSRSANRILDDLVIWSKYLDQNISKNSKNVDERPEP